jgi:hypothetical protein
MYGRIQLRLWIQGGFRVEVVVLEDGEDQCEDLCEKWREVNPAFAIRYERFEGTLGAKLNRGAELARGKYLINWDDDDYQHPERIENIVKHFELTGVSMVGMSSMLYYREGDDHGWEYNAGDARYCTGSGQAFLREWALKNPHPDITVGEDEHMCRIAAEQGVLSTISGTQWVIACTHDSHCTPRKHPEEAAWEQFFGKRASNWRGPIPFQSFSWIKPYLFQPPA